MAAKRKAAKAGTGMWAAGKAVRNNPYIERLVEDDDLRDNLRTAFESSRKAYERIADGRGPGAIVDDKRTQRDLREAAGALRDAADALRGTKRKRKAKRRGGLLMVGLVGLGAAVTLNEGLRNKLLDLLFGAEEEFEYSSSTTAQTSPPVAGGGAGAAGTSAATTAGAPPSGAPEGPVGTS
ncbi:MAG TPA: hypothetical protein VK387_05655 [Thermoleophilaceae bacterium]|nr:hypothetical protein [Thermoleophilaceae bacterium]